jgi:hypothetical protein
MMAKRETIKNSSPSIPDKMSETAGYAYNLKTNRNLWILIILATFSGLFGLRLLNININYSQYFTLIPSVPILLYLGLITGFIKRNIPIFLAVNMYGQILFASLAILLWSYIGVAVLTHLPLVNDALDIADKRLGFDWDAYTRFFCNKRMVGAAIAILLRLL